MNKFLYIIPVLFTLILLNISNIFGSSYNVGGTTYFNNVEEFSSALNLNSTQKNNFLNYVNNRTNIPFFVSVGSNEVLSGLGHFVYSFENNSNIKAYNSYHQAQNGVYFNWCTLDGTYYTTKYQWSFYYGNFVAGSTILFDNIYEKACSISPNSYVYLNNIPIYNNSSYSSVVLSSSVPPVVPVTPVYTSSVNINLPNDNFEDNSNIFSFSAYSKINLVDNFDISKLTFKITYDNGLIPSETNLYYKSISSSGFIQDEQYHFLNTFELGIPVGVHTVRLTAFYNNVEITYGEKTVNHLAGFVDADGDTLDDRTGRTNANIGTSTNYNTLDPSQLNPLDPIGSATYIKNQASTFFEFINFLFSSFPAWITVPLAFLFLCLIIGIIIKILL